MKENKIERFVVRITEQEQEILKRFSIQEDKSMSNLFRDTFLKAAKESIKDSILPNDFFILEYSDGIIIPYCFISEMTEGGFVCNNIFGDYVVFLKDDLDGVSIERISEELAYLIDDKIEEKHWDFEETPHLTKDEFKELIS